MNRILNQNQFYRNHEVITFGEYLDIINVKPIKVKSNKGGYISFEITWHFKKPLPEEKIIAFYIGNKENPIIQFVDTKQFVFSGIKYKDVFPGKTYTDTIIIPIPIDSKEGVYEVSTFIFPPSDYELRDYCSTIHYNQAFLFEIELYSTLETDLQTRFRHLEERNNKLHKILITGFYGFDNTGDEAILCCIINDLKAHNFHPVVLSGNPPKTSSLYNVEAFNRNTELDIAIEYCDGVISGGGSLLQDITDLDTIPYYLEPIQKAHEHKKPVFFYAQGIGPISHKSFFPIIKTTLEDCEYLSVRDLNSKLFLENEVGIKKSIEVIPDPALFPLVLPSNDLSESLTNFLNKKPIIISVRPWEGRDKIVKEISKLASKLLSDCQPVLFLPFQYPFDVEVAREIIDHMNVNFTKNNFYLVDEPLKIEQYFTIIRASKLVIGMRLHSLIFAASQATPFIGISYDPKTDSFIKQFNKHINISINNICGELLYSEVQNVLNNYSDKKKSLENTLFKLRNTISPPSKALKKYFYKGLFSKLNQLLYGLKLKISYI